jgi:hypothetical protein
VSRRYTYVVSFPVCDQQQQEAVLKIAAALSINVRSIQYAFGFMVIDVPQTLLDAWDVAVREGKVKAPHAVAYRHDGRYAKRFRELVLEELGTAGDQ